MSTKPIVITPESDIVGNSSHELKKELSVFIENGKIDLKLDLHKVRIIDSLGIGVLVEREMHFGRRMVSFALLI